MSFLRDIFQKKKKATPSTKQIEETLQASYDLLVKQKETLEQQIEENKKIAISNAELKRAVASKALHKKKRLEKTLSQIDDFVTIVEAQKDEIESASRIEALKVCMNNAQKLKKATKSTNNDKHRKLIKDINKQHCMVNDISNIITRNAVPDMTEEELAREIEKLEMEELEKDEPPACKSTEPPEISVVSQKGETSKGMIPSRAEKVLETEA